MECEAPQADVAALIAAFGAPEPHDLHVARLSERLFGLTAGLHGLSADYLPILTAGAQLRNVGLAGGGKKHHLRGRKMILEKAGGSPGVAVKMVALMAGYHRKKVALGLEPLLAELTPAERVAALRLAGIVRIADGLDYTQDQQLEIVDCERTIRSVTLLVKSANGNAAVNVGKASAKADLWNALFPIPLLVEDLSAHEKAQRRPVLMSPTDTMAEAGRKVLLHHLRKCLSCEAGVRAGEDIEQLHDMRVATRRMRSAFRVFGGYMPEDRMQPFLESLRWLAAALGAVRDRDVFLEFLEGYVRRAPTEDHAVLNQLLGHRRRERTRYRKALTDALDSDRYRAFATDFEAFLSNPEHVLVEGSIAPTVLATAPGVIRKRLKKVSQHRKSAPYADSQQLHELRIACKRLRYAAEFVDPCFDSAFSTLIKQCVKIQDALGNVHDADVYTHFLQDYMTRLMPDEEARQQERAALERLIADIANWRHENLASFWTVWPEVAGKKKAVAQLQALLDGLAAGRGAAG
jgi:CHAD domain-containing protein